MEKQHYKNENIERKYSKVKNTLLESEKDFIELNCIELRYRIADIKREKEDIDIFEEEEMKKIRPIKNTWYDWVINFIPKPIRKSVSVLKGKVLNLYKKKTPEQTVLETNTPEKQTVYGRGKKLSKPRKQNIKKPFT